MIEITSMMSKNSKVFRAASVTISNYERYILLTYKVTNDGSETLLSGIVSLGNDDFPYGFYDIDVYGAGNGTSLTPSANYLVYKGVANFTDKGSNPGTVYKTYNKNDKDTDSIYITNTI